MLNLSRYYCQVYCHVEIVVLTTAMQDVAGKSGDHRNMIIRDITGEMLRVVTNVFEPKASKAKLITISANINHRTFAFLIHLIVSDFQMLP
jgi:hypothetical protein